MSSKLSVEQVMKRLRDYVKSDGATNYLIENDSSEVFHMDELMKNREENNCSWNIRSEFPLRSVRPIIGRFITLFKKLMRKSLRWYIDPIIKQQNSFNGSITRSINEVANILGVVSIKLKEALVTNEKLQQLLENKEELYSLKNELEQFSEKSENYEEELQDAKSQMQENETLLKQLSMVSENYEEELQNVKSQIQVDETLLKQLSMVSENYEEELQNAKNQIQEDEALLKQLYMKFENYEEELQNAKNHNNTFVNEIIQKIQENNKDTFNSLLSENAFLSDRVRRLERKCLNEVVNHTKSIVPSNEGSTNSDNSSFDYFLFEHRYRGSEQQIKDGLKVFVKYFSNCNNVLDIGCGRGEFIELLKENSINARGIDINEDFIRHCKDKGLDVEYNNALSYLDGLSDDSLDGIFISHVIEHINFSELCNIFEFCYTKLKKDSNIVVSSPNPRTLAIFRNAFYVDPNHTKPFHPETLKFLLSSIGFKDLEEHHYDFSKEDFELPLIDGENIKNLDDFNNGIGVLNSILFGYQDYTIIARK